MRINDQQTIAKFLFSRKIIIIPLVVMVFLFVSASISFAPTKLSAKNPDQLRSLRSHDVMNDQELSDVNAQSFFFQMTQFADTRGSQNVIRLDLGVNMVTNAHIESFKMGYYDNGPHTGWDIDVTNYFWGGMIIRPAFRVQASSGTAYIWNWVLTTSAIIAHGRSIIWISEPNTPPVRSPGQLTRSTYWRQAAREPITAYRSGRRHRVQESLISPMIRFPLCSR